MPGRLPQLDIYNLLSFRQRRTAGEDPPASHAYVFIAFRNLSSFIRETQATTGYVQSSPGYRTSTTALSAWRAGRVFQQVKRACPYRIDFSRCARIRHIRGWCRLPANCALSLLSAACLGPADSWRKTSFWCCSFALVPTILFAWPTPTPNCGRQRKARRHDIDTTAPVGGEGRPHRFPLVCPKAAPYSTPVAAPSASRRPRPPPTAASHRRHPSLRQIFACVGAGTAKASR